MAVFEKVQDIIVDELGKEKEEVTLETSFEELNLIPKKIKQVGILVGALLMLLSVYPLIS